jgi:N-acetylglucosaminyldiphosphoundecaprenol N-acetyl-beta-D-mannosaminyltransferase
MNIEELRRNRFIRNFAKDKWLIFASTGTITLFALLYVMFLYKPLYQSEAKVWIKDTASKSYVADDGGSDPGYFSSLTTSGNPVMTQSEILTSKEMENYMADYVIQEQARTNHGKVMDDKPDTEKIIKVKTEPNTDIMQVQLKWKSPEMAQSMLSAAIDKLDERNLEINRQIYTKKRVYLEQQLKGIGDKLAAVREKLKQFQAGSMVVDVDSQTQELIKLRSQLVSQLETAKAAQRAHAVNSATLQREMSMSPKAALQAVALGSGNESLVKMRTNLSALKEQYAHDSVKQAPTNPQLVALKQQINSLQAQIDDEIAQTVGKTDNKNLRIYDTVRGNLAQMMNEFSARSVAMGTEAASLQAAINKVDASLRAMPKSRYTLTSLQEEEKALALAYDELSKKQIEAQIKEAEMPSNVLVVDPPSLPKHASFPTDKHVVVLAMLLGLGVGMGLSILKTNAEDRADGADAVEEATRSKVLGVVPWNNEPGLEADHSHAIFTMNDVATKHIISNLRLEAAKHNARMIAFTSSSLEKPYLGGTYHLAQRLSALGQSVAFIDADFRPSRLFEMVVDPRNAMDLTDLILATDLKLRNGQPVYADDVLSGFMRDASGMYMAMNRNNVANPYDYFASKGFRYIIDVLKEQFDWVFIDTPPAAIAPEFKIIAHISDGVVLFADKHATTNTLRTMADKVCEAQVPLIGSIVREQNNRLERDHEIYTNWRGPRKGGGSLVASGNGYAKKRVEFMGAKIDALTMQETLTRIAEIIDRREKVQHVVVNVAKLMTMRHDRKLRNIVNNSDLINADGAGIVLGARMLGINIPERVAGIDLMQKLVELSSQQDYRIFFLGAEEDVARDVVTYYKRLYPNLQICGYRNGYFKPEEEQAVAEHIRDMSPDILFVGMSSPKKEKFIDKYRDLMNVPFVMGVGGSMDVVAGKVKRAPEWMQHSGMEWFFRLTQEPGRMWKRYLVTNVQFGWALAEQALTMRMGHANG